MLENCHGALPLHHGKAAGERNASTRYSVVKDNFSGIAARERANRPPNEKMLRGMDEQERRFCRDCGRIAVTDRRDHNQPLDCWKCNRPMEFYQVAFRDRKETERSLTLGGGS